MLRTLASTRRYLGPPSLPRVRAMPRARWGYASASPSLLGSRSYASTSPSSSDKKGDPSRLPTEPSVGGPDDFSRTSSSPSQSASQPVHPPSDWDENPDLTISAFSQLPSSNFGVNQHMIINEEFKEALRQILWQFRAPIRYAFAYGSGVFPQTAVSTPSASSNLHPRSNPAIAKVQGNEGKMIDFIFGVSYTQHWHSLNLQQHRDHYSAVGSLGSYFVSRIQDKWGAGVYFNPFVTLNGTLIKYGVVNLDTLCRDLSEWDTLYLAGRLQKPVKILRDDPRVRLANQVNLLSAVRTALLLLPPTFTELDLYGVIAGISYLGDPRMSLRSENPHKIANIVNNQLSNFRRLYAPLIQNLPNVSFNDHRYNQPNGAEDPTINMTLVQDNDPIKRGNMVRRLPKKFREKLYFQYQSKFQIPRAEFHKMLEESNDEDPSRVRRKLGGRFEQRVAGDDPDSLKKEASTAIKRTIGWPSRTQTVKSLVTAGVGRSWRYVMEKMEKYREGQRKEREMASRSKNLGSENDKKS